MTESPNPVEPSHFDAVVLGAGVSGIYQIKRLIDLGFNAVVLESEAGPGGTWFRNRYPGARFDSESYTYGYSWSQEVLDTWHWKERFSGQPENLRYLNHVIDTHDLRRHMRFDARVTAMEWEENARRWHVHVANEPSVTADVVVTCVGLLSAPTPPVIAGMEDFGGESHHTFFWPDEPVELAGRRVGIIGTGATGIQVIAEIADKVGELFVFQRRPNWSAPLNNAPITEAEMADIRDRYDEIFARCDETPGGFEHAPDRRGFWNVSEAERRELWDHLYDNVPGFGVWLQNFTEIFTDPDANAEFSAYVADRIRGRVNDPAVAEKLIPTDHGFGVQRVPMESGYFEAFNRPNVHLVDVAEAPIKRVTETGIETAAGHYDLDLIIYATGFDAVTGAFDRIAITGTNGEKLATKWADGPRTYLGVATHGFPNLVMVAGPQSASSSTNFPRAIENSVDFVTGLLRHVKSHQITRFEPSLAAEDDWVATIEYLYQALLLRKAKGWFTGYNSNVAGHEEGRIRYVVYNGGAPKYRRTVAEVAEAGYSGFEFSD